ncbi:FG-GAP-like repeat-containing protein [Streptomyces sp. A1136]|uniref:FG-GAP-like repeat-containing protein n=1 Tax=Streptomyces sp. A1136 TaxID=2563102 RepID=UPI00109E7BCE|nr:FG-GAP-like repeat-containing protein [Streptomyces sp. A1136]THA44569.1 hypothetical protein E6R62_36735 [Streptomyces sp. A1136]
MATTGLNTASASGAEAAYPFVNRAFNNTAISADANPSTADFDGSGNSLSAAALDNAGWTRGAHITVNGTVYTRPDVAPGQPDNVVATGQTLSVTGSGDALGFLTAATHGTVSGSGTVTYSDGSTSAYTLSANDWSTGNPTAAAVTLSHSNAPTGQQTRPVNLYATTVPIARGKTVASVTLPNTAGSTPATGPALHIFSLSVRSTPAAPGGRAWTGSWATSFGSAPAVPQSPDWKDQTLRMVVHPHTSGGTARIRFANTFSPAPVRLGHVTVAEQAAGAKAAQTPVSLTFGGSRQATIPAGGELVSDPVDFPVAPDQDLAVSVHLPDSVTVAPIHSYALATSYTTSRLGGDHTTDTNATAFTGSFSFWTLLSGVDVATSGNPGTVVALGDSQTDGGHTTKDANHRWPDYYAAALNGHPSAPGVLNAGLSANRILLDRTDQAGPSALTRLDRDVFAQPNASAVVLYEGVNDILSGNADVGALKEGIQRIAAHVRARGLPITVATVPPFGGNTDYSDAREDVRQGINAYIRTTGDINGYIDFDLATRDPDVPSRLQDAYVDPVDRLHFNDLGTKHLADTLAAGTNGTPLTMSQTAAGDFDGDGIADLIACYDATGTLKMWRGRGDGTFSSHADVTNGWRPFTQTVAADFNSDGRADIMARDAWGNLKMWLGRGDGSFGVARQVTSGWEFTQTAVGDVDGNGKADIIARDSSGDLKIWAGRGDGTFGAAQQLSSGWNFTQTVLADFNGDGQADIVAKDSSGTLKMWTHNAGGYFNSAKDVTGGWNFSQTTAAASTKDGHAGLMARDDTTGTLKMWAGRGDGTFASARNLTTGW